VHGRCSNDDGEELPQTTSLVEAVDRRQCSGPAVPESRPHHHPAGGMAHAAAQQARKSPGAPGGGRDGRAAWRAGKGCASSLRGVQGEAVTPSEQFSESGGSSQEHALGPEGILRSLCELRELCETKTRSWTQAVNDTELKKQVQRERLVLQAREGLAEVGVMEEAAQRQEVEARAVEKDHRRGCTLLAEREQELICRERSFAELEAGARAELRSREREFLSCESGLAHREEWLAQSEKELLDRWRQLLEHHEAWRVQQISESEEFERTTSRLREDLRSHDAEMQQKFASLREEEERLRERWLQIDERELRWENLELHRQLQEQQSGWKQQDLSSGCSSSVPSPCPRFVSEKLAEADKQGRGLER